MSGAPEDLKESGNVGRVWRKIDKIDAKIEEHGEKITKLCEDVAFIRGKLEGAQIVDEHKFSFRSGSIIAVIGAGAAGVFEFIFHYFH